MFISIYSWLCLQNVSRIKILPSNLITHTLVCTIILFCLDYCNGLLIFSCLAPTSNLFSGIQGAPESKPSLTLSLISNLLFLSSSQNESSIVFSILLFKGWYNIKLKRIRNWKTLRSNATTYHLCTPKIFNLSSQISNENNNIACSVRLL